MPIGFRVCKRAEPHCQVMRQVWMDVQELEKKGVTGPHRLDSDSGCRFGGNLGGYGGH